MESYDYLVEIIFKTSTSIFLVSWPLQNYLLLEYLLLFSKANKQNCFSMFGINITAFKCDMQILGTNIEAFNK